MSIGVSGDKPKKAYQLLGPDVTIENEDSFVDAMASQRLEDTGKCLTPAGHDYLGSIAIHYFVTTTSVTTIKKDIIFAQQFHVNDVADSAIVAGVSALQHTVARQFLGQKMNSTDPKDKR